MRVITAFLLLILSAYGTAETIDFQALEHADALNTSEGNSYEESGYRVEQLPPTVSTLNTFGTAEARYTGSTALFNNDDDGVTQLTRIDGEAFDLISIDLAELNGNLVASITFTTNTGHTQTFTLDGTAFNAETFSFDSGFRGITSVTWVQVAPYHQFDNSVVQASSTAPSAIPVGGGIFLAALAVVLGAFGYRAQIKRTA
jgi:hypothetical protein